MSRRTHGAWLLPAVGAIVAFTVAGLIGVWLSPHRADLATYGAYAVALVTLAGGWIAWALRASRQADGAIAGQELGRLADLLAGAVESQWSRAAGERGLLAPEPIPVRWQRPTAAVGGPVAAAAALALFPPLPGLAAVGEKQLRAGLVNELHAVYGGLGSGRLVITGSPGSGKSSAAVLLILTALRHRRSVPAEVRPQVPVPVMFTLQEWDPGTQPLRDWLGERLGRTYPMFAGNQGRAAAERMLDEGLIAVMLDGLDEIPEGVRPVVLSALSQQATFRLVLLTRTAEMASAAAQAVLHGAVAIELQDIDSRTAADYLARTQLDPLPRAWHKLISRLRDGSGSPLAQALNNPLMLTLLRDTYRAADDVGELLVLRDAAGRPASSWDIADHLLDRVLPAAYTRQPGEPPLRYNLSAAEDALRCIAAQMNEDGVRDLQWWRVPVWVPAGPRALMTWLGAAIVVGAAAAAPAGIDGGINAGTHAGLADALASGIAFGIAAGSVAAIASGRGRKIPKRLAPVRWRQIFRPRALAVGLLAGLALDLAIVLIPGLRIAFGLLGEFLAGIAFALSVWLGAAIVPAASRPGIDVTSPLSPLSSWRSDRAHGLVAGLVTGLSAALVSGLVAGITTGLVPGLAVGISTWLGVGLVVWLVYPQAWSCSLAFAQLAASRRTPVRLLRFLEDARSRNVLRTVGPVYQFRHGRFQDRLASHEWARARTGKPQPTGPDGIPVSAEFCRRRVESGSGSDPYFIS